MLFRGGSFSSKLSYARSSYPLSDWTALERISWMILPSWGSLATEAETRIVFLFEDSELPIGSMYLAAAEAR